MFDSRQGRRRAWCCRPSRPSCLVDGARAWAVDRDCVSWRMRGKGSAWPGSVTHTASRWTSQPGASHRSTRSSCKQGEPRQDDEQTIGQPLGRSVGAGRGGAHYSRPATWKPCPKQKSVHMAYVIRLSTLLGPLRSRPLALSRMQRPSVAQPLAASVSAASTGPVGWLGIVDAGLASVVKMTSAWSATDGSEQRKEGSQRRAQLRVRGCEQGGLRWGRRRRCCERPSKASCLQAAWRGSVQVSRGA
jgi:hypothetical protein